MPKYDFMSFGEADIRLTPPGHDRLGQTDTLQLGISAAELNCCVNISNLSMNGFPNVKDRLYYKASGAVERTLYYAERPGLWGGYVPCAGGTIRPDRQDPQRGSTLWKWVSAPGLVCRPMTGAIPP